MSKRLDDDWDPNEHGSIRDDLSEMELADWLNYHEFGIEMGGNRRVTHLIRQGERFDVRRFGLKGGLNEHPEGSDRGGHIPWLKTNFEKAYRPFEGEWEKAGG
jgi:hypothetical protein